MKLFLILLCLSPILHAAEKKRLKYLIKSTYPSQLPNLLAGPYDEFWYQHALTTAIVKNKNRLYVKLFTASHLGKQDLMDATIETATNSFPTLIITTIYDLSQTYHITPVLFSRILDVLKPANANNSPFFAEIKYSFALNRIGCTRTSAIAHTKKQSNFVLFSVDHTKKISYLKQHGILKDVALTTLTENKSTENVFQI